MNEQNFNNRIKHMCSKFSEKMILEDSMKMFVAKSEVLLYAKDEERMQADKSDEIFIAIKENLAKKTLFFISVCLALGIWEEYVQGNEEEGATHSFISLDINPDTLDHENAYFSKSQQLLGKKNPNIEDSSLHKDLIGKQCLFSRRILYKENSRNLSHIYGERTIHLSIPPEFIGSVIILIEEEVFQTIVYKIKNNFENYSDILG